MKNPEVEAFVADLRRISRGDLGEDEFRARYMNAAVPSFVAEVWHGLQHFLADADIRAKDPGYREMQERELERLIGLLQQGAPKEDLRRITFLAPSKG